MKKPRSRILVIPVVAALLSSCAPFPMKTEYGTPIPTEHVGKLSTGKTTKSDVIAWFGMPSGGQAAGPGVPVGGAHLPNAALASGQDEIYMYNHCSVSASSKSRFALVSGESEAATTCEQLAILFDKRGLVTAFSHHTRDPVNEDNIGKIGKASMSKADVIQTFGAPTRIDKSGNDEVFTYENCVARTRGGTGLGLLFGQPVFETAQDCKRLTMIIDGASKQVKTHSYQPGQQRR